MLLRSALCALALSFAAAGVAAAANGPQPLRTLVYRVQFTTLARDEEQASGLSPRARGAVRTGSGGLTHIADADDDGTLTVVVVAATLDLGLVVDASFTGQRHQQTPVRVAIYQDGRLAYDPRSELSEEAARLLPLLARGLLLDRDLSPGSSWTTAREGGEKGSTTFRVKHVENGQATLEIEGDVTAANGQGFYAERRTGTLLYATERTCPLRYEMHVIARRKPGIAEQVIEDNRLTATLVSDSLRT